MAPSPGTDSYHKHFFNDPTLSDLTIRLSDRTVYVHRIVPCRRSAYFGKLILGGFKIELHDDDPDAMVALFRCIYDLPCDELSNLTACSTTLELLAGICVGAEKYQVKGVQAKVAEQMEKTLWEKADEEIYTYGGQKPQDDPADFLAATKIVFDGISQQDNACWVALVKFCALCIIDLNKLPGFVELLNECAGLAAAMNLHDGLKTGIHGHWNVNDDQRLRQAVPRCPERKQVFSTLYVVKNLSNIFKWTCEYCDEKVWPVCSEYHEDYDARLTWIWKEEDEWYSAASKV